MDDVGATYDTCADKGVTITSTLGRHTNDRMTSFYMRTPSGFLVEYGHGGRLIDDERWEVQLHRSPACGAIARHRACRRVPGDDGSAVSLARRKAAKRFESKIARDEAERTTGE